jgi:hypothetical protein
MNITENVQRKILLTIAASAEELTTPMIRRACGWEAGTDIATRLHNLLAQGAIRCRKTATGERWFQVNPHWRPSRDPEAVRQFEAALAKRGKPAEQPAPAILHPRAIAAPDLTTQGKFEAIAPPDEAVATEDAPQAEAASAAQLLPEAPPAPEPADAIAAAVEVEVPSQGPAVAAAPAQDEPSLARQVLDRLVGLAQRGMAAQHAPAGTVVVDQVAKPQGLRDRVEAVLTDMEDVVGDACDLQLDHDTIKALVISLAAMQRAARKLPA